MSAFAGNLNRIERKLPIRAAPKERSRAIAIACGTDASGRVWQTLKKRYIENHHERGAIESWEMKRIPILIYVAVIGTPVAIFDAAAQSDKPAPEEIIAGLQSSNATTRTLAVIRGLKSDDRSIRALAIRYSLKDSSSLQLTVSGARGDAAAADFMEKMPSFNIFNIRWNNDGKDFSGEFASKGRVANGSINGESLSIGIQFVEIPAANRRVNVATCNAALMLNATRDALEGPLKCSGVPYRFTASLGL